GSRSSVNRRNIEERANRYFFVKDPVTLDVQCVGREVSAKLLLHPDQPERGTRDYTVKPLNGTAQFKISRDDAEKMEASGMVRLMGLMNIEILDANPTRILARYHSKGHEEAREKGAAFIHWLPDGVGIDAGVMMPDASKVRGLAEPGCMDLKIDAMIQFERFGFVRVDKQKPFSAYFAHR
ncbi:glutamyl- or glutaminyl-tRNA synthetase, partial [Thaumarchaeota archaeon SCGC AB-539-E09]